MNKQSAFKALESLINKAMDYDPSSQTRVTHLAGKSLKIECTLPQVCLYILFRKESVSLKDQYENTPDITLKGTALSFGSLSINMDKRVSFFNSGIHISGDQELLSRLQDLFKNLDIDWEASLSDIIGDIPANLIGKSLRSSLDWKRNMLKRTTTAAIEFSQEEVRLIPSTKEVDGFNKKVKQIQNETERLAAKTKKLKSKIDDSANNINKHPAQEGVTKKL